MENNSGIVYNKHIQIKMLILFVMSRLPRPVSLETLTELAMCDERISYFDVTECIEKLVRTKHLLLTDDRYSITAKGKRNSEILEEDLPRSVRIKAEDAAVRLGEVQKRDSLITAYTAAADNGGWNVKLSLSDGIGEILSVSIYTSGKEQALSLEKGFRKNAHNLYHDISDVICK